MATSQLKCEKKAYKSEIQEEEVKKYKNAVWTFVIETGNVF